MAVAVAVAVVVVVWTQEISFADQAAWACAHLMAQILESDHKDTVHVGCVNSKCKVYTLSEYEGLEPGYGLSLWPVAVWRWLWSGAVPWGVASATRTHVRFPRCFVTPLASGSFRLCAGRKNQRWERRTRSHTSCRYDRGALA